MVVHGTDGDVLPFVRVAGALRDRGHRVTVFSHQYYAPVVRRAGLDFVPVDTIAEYEHYLRDAAGQVGATRAEDFRDHFVRSGLLTQLRFECRELRDRYRPGETVLVGSAISGQSVLIAAEALGAPVVCLAHAPFQLMALAGVARAYRLALADKINSVRAEWALPPVRDWSAWMASADAYVGLWPDWFDRAGQPAPAGTELAGFVLADEDAEADLPARATALLTGETAPVLVTGGTGRLLQRRFYQSAVAAIESLGRSGLLVVRHRDLVPDPLPPNVHWFDRLPFRAVVPRVSTVVHHGGIGTLGRALASGTPQVILADGLDRPDNARRLARHGVARWLPPERWTAADIAGSLRQASSTVPGAVDPEGSGGGGRRDDPTDGSPPEGPRRAAWLIEQAFARPSTAREAST